MFCCGLKLGIFGIVIFGIGLGKIEFFLLFVFLELVVEVICWLVLKFDYFKN